MDQTHLQKPQQDQWQINRAGVVNFWYYDDEEFLFEDGRLLLRGANGSGKSVTMQSLDPLLFDGNKSPERLDPFGSRARRMESYLLSEGLDLEERIGYLFLEFYKRNAGRYITIGMGMRARKNMALQSWYFIVLDNRRVGNGYDLPLYKDLGEKIPLTAKELENRIGQGGHFFTSQREYKEAVNEHLFGFGDISDFDELIELLIQIRSPKLSKEFKPTTMYEIMQNSLITLDDDDLRPMSEAIENMDEIKTKIEALEKAQKALSRIDAVYSRYNTYMLASKAQHYGRAVDNQRQLEQQLLKLKDTAASQTVQFEQLNRKINGLDTEEKQMKDKAESLKDHDLSRLSKEKNDLELTLAAQRDQLQQKEQQLDAHKAREREIEKERKDKTAIFETCRDKIKDKLDILKTHSEACQFDEHAFFDDEYSSLEKPYNFSFLTHQLGTYKSRLKKGLSLLTEMERLRVKYEEALEQLSEANRDKELQQKQVQETERLFNETKSEYVEKMFHWLKENRVLKLDREAVNKAAERVYHFGNPFYFDRIMSPIREAADKIRNGINETISTLNAERSSLSRALDDKRTALEVLKNQTEPEPERDEKVRKNRIRLSEAGIPHIPLYKAVDFSGELDEALKGILEEALLDLGILDALIVLPEYKEQVLCMDSGMADKYLFSDPELLSFTLSSYLKPDNYKEEILPSIVDNVLSSMFIDEDNTKCFITEKGEYGLGIIRGKASGTCQSRFIGYQSRKLYKQQLMDDLLADMKKIRSDIDKLEDETRILKEQLKQGDLELDSFPSPEDLSVAHQETLSAVSAFQRCEKAVEKAGQASEALYKALKDKRIEVQEETAKINLPPRSEVYDKAIQELDEYNDGLNDLMLKDQAYWYTKDILRRLEAQYEHCLDSIEATITDVQQLEKAVKQAEDRIASIEHELSLSDYQDIRDQINYCLSRLESIPNEKTKAVKEQEYLRFSLENSQNTMESLAIALKKAAVIKSVYENGFRQEYDLGYVSTVERDKGEELHSLARRILRAWGAVLDEKKQLFEIRDDLQERLLKEGGELAEYNLKRIDLFKEDHEAVDALSDTAELALHLQRMDIVGKVSGREIKFYALSTLIEEQIRENGALLSEQDRELFEDILIKSISRKISGKIYHSEKWVEKINDLMQGMKTSSGLNFSLKWVTKKAQSEDQMGTKELVEILKMDQGLLTAQQREGLIRHFRSKIQETRIRTADETEQRSFLAIMKDILDYRKWFEFQLYYVKKGEVRKEMTNNAFFTFSGGEKAMAMYVPLFSAVYAKYQGGRTDCPKVISLDEAFAGVDENNINDMFRLLVELKLSFVANSQVLLGDYKTVPALSIYELIRPENVTYVTMIRYRWNGFTRTLVNEAEELDEANDRTGT